jgi:hypothetical protein
MRLIVLIMIQPGEGKEYYERIAIRNIITFV